MKYLTLIFCAVFLFFGMTTKASATTYYVDGNIANPFCGGGYGTYIIAARTCGGSGGPGAFKTIGTALTSGVSQGDIIYVRAGTYAEAKTGISVLIGTGGGLTFTPYNNETVIIDPAAYSGYLWFLNSSTTKITFDGGPNRTLIFQNSLVNTAPFFYIPSGNITITRSVITDSAARVSDGFIHLDQGYAGGTLTLSRNLIHNTAGILIYDGNGSGAFTINLTANQMDTINKILYISGSGATLNEVNNTVVRSAGVMHSLSSGSGMTINLQNNIFVLKTNGTINNLFTIAAGLTIPSWTFKNNILWRESITSYADYSNIIFGSYSNNIDKSNKFINPSFTAYGTGYTDANLTLQNISTNYATGRGLNSSLPSGGDYTGTAWPVNDNSVGAYINPTISPNSYPTLINNKVAFAGDSIMAGVAASDNTHTEWGQFGVISGLSTVNNGSGANDLAAISGQSIEGAEFLIDRTIFEATPKTVFISIGINDLAGTPTLVDNADKVLGVKVIFDKLIDAGITPIWLGVESKIGNPPDNTVPIDFNNQVLATCATYNISCGSILSQMMLDTSWKTDYYSDLAGGNVHPNDAGHLLIARLAEYLYYSHHTVATDKVDIGAGARIYADGKFRDLGTTNSSTVTLSITPQGGVGLFNANDKSFWLDVTNITNWTNSHKTWTESNAQTSNMVTDHTVGDLDTNKNYNITVSDVDAKVHIVGINGTTCNTIGINRVCKSDNDGKIYFRYDGGYSPHTFDIVAGDNTPPVATATPAGGTYGASRDVTLSCVDDSSGCNHTYYTTDGTTPTTGSTIYSVPVTISTNTTLKFFSTDLAGNPETPKTETYVIDTTYPVTDITSNPTTTTNSTSATFVFSANKTGSTFQCKLDSGSYTACTSPQAYTSLTEGSHTFMVKATDTLSHTEPTPPSYTWVVDTLAPSAVGAPSFGTITSTSIVVVKPATVTETGSGLYQWQVRKNSTTELGFNNISTTSITDSALLENTQYTYDVQFSDNATNVSSYGTQASKYTLVDTPTNLSASSSSNNVSLTVDSFPNDTSGQSGYYFSRSQGGNSGWIQTNSWQDTGLSCGTSYTYSVIYRNGDGTETSSISTSQSTGGCSHGGGRLVPNYVTPIIPIINNPTNTLTSVTYNFGPTTLRNGSKGEAVKELQRFLNNNLPRLGVGLNLHLIIDGKLGPKTIAVIKKWQKANGLVADGLVGKLTKARMNGGI